jgi:hypothetical protein
MGPVLHETSRRRGAPLLLLVSCNTGPIGSHFRNGRCRGSNPILFQKCRNWFHFLVLLRSHRVFTGNQKFSTVTENMTHFTTDECKRAAEARLFMGRLGSSNSMSAKRMMKNIHNCSVINRDVDIADIIYGPKSVSALMGESKKENRQQQTSSSDQRYHKCSNTSS